MGETITPRLSSPDPPNVYPTPESAKLAVAETTTITVSANDHPRLLIALNHMAVATLRTLSHSLRSFFVSSAKDEHPSPS